MGRPTKKIDVAQLERLAERLWTIEEIAAFFRVSRDTVERRFAAKIASARLLGTAKLRDLQWKLAETLHPAMLMHLGKYYLDQSDNQKEPERVQTGTIIYETEWGSAYEPSGNQCDLD